MKADLRISLKVKIKSLAEEARIIKKEEQRNPHLQNYLRQHRIDVVRKEARNSLIAYAIIRGMAYDDVETNPQSEPNWAAVEAMVKKYGTSMWLNYNQPYQSKFYPFCSHEEQKKREKENLTLLETYKKRFQKQKEAG